MSARQAYAERPANRASTAVSAGSLRMTTPSPDTAIRTRSPSPSRAAFRDLGGEADRQILFPAVQ